MNGAHKRNSVQDQDPGNMLVQLAELSMKRELERKRLRKMEKGAIPLSARAILDEGKGDFSCLSMDFIGLDRNRIKFTAKNLEGKKAIRMAVLDTKAPECGCEAPFVDELSCGCLLHAAEKKGACNSEFLDLHDTSALWKSQYEGLSEIKITGNEVVQLLHKDRLTPLPAVKYPQKPGRPANARTKSAPDTSSIFKKAKFTRPKAADANS